MRRPLALAAVVVSVVTSASADDAFLPGAESDMPTVLSATRLRQAIADAPASITVIDRPMIAQSGVRELPELLRLVPGMVVGYDSGWEAFVGYHGTSADMARRMQVLVDGRSIYQPSLAYVDWIGLPLELEDIDRIEVIRGPNAASYGANSFLGIVNIITRHPADLPRLRAYSRVGGNGIRDNFVGANHVQGAFSAQLSVSQRRDDGYLHLLDKNKEIVRDYEDDKDQKAVSGKLAWEFSPDSILTLRAGHSELKGQNKSGDGGFVEFLDTHDTETSQDFLALAFEQSLGNHNLQATANYSRFREDEALRFRTYPGLILPELRELFVFNRWHTRQFLNAVLSNDVAKMFSGDPPTDALVNKVLGRLTTDPVLTSQQIFHAAVDNRESRTELEVQDTWTLSPDLRVVYGAGWQKSTSESAYYFNGEVENTMWRVFAHGEWQFVPDWRLNVGVMDEHDDLAGNLVSPRAALNWRFAPTQSLRLVSSVAYRTPDLQESRSNWEFHVTAEDPAYSAYNGAFFYLGQVPVGMTCINSTSHGGLVCSDGADSEKIVSREIGYYGEFPSSRVTLDVRLFSDRLDLTEHNLEIENFVIAPLERHEQRGVEVSGQWRPLPQWRVLANYAYDDITGYNDNTMFVPKHSGNVAVWYETPAGMQASAGYVFYNHLFYNAVEDKERDLHLMNLRAARKWTLNNRHDLELAGVWQIRLTDDNELRKENGAPRDRMWLQLTYAFE